MNLQPTSTSSPGLHDKAFDETFLDSNMSQVQEECKLLLQSPVITKQNASQTPGTTLPPTSLAPGTQLPPVTQPPTQPSSSCNCTSAETEERILRNVIEHCNLFMLEYFRPIPNGEFQIQLESIVTARLNEMNETTASFNNTLDTSRHRAGSQSQEKEVGDKIDDFIITNIKQSRNNAQLS